MVNIEIVIAKKTMRGKGQKRSRSPDRRNRNFHTPDSGGASSPHTAGPLQRPTTGCFHMPYAEDFPEEDEGPYGGFCERESPAAHSSGDHKRRRINEKTSPQFAKGYSERPLLKASKYRIKQANTHKQ